MIEEKDKNFTILQKYTDFSNFRVNVLFSGERELV